MIDSNTAAASSGETHQDCLGLAMALDRSRSPLGPLADWPDTLSSAFRLLAPSASPAMIFWGPEHIAIYNDACATIIGDRHPAAFGRPAGSTWPERWHELEPVLLQVRNGGGTAEARGQAFYDRRESQREDPCFDFAYSPIHENGAVAGVLVILSDAMQRVKAERAYRESQKSFRDVQNNSVDAHMIFESVRDADGRITDFTWVHANRPAALIVGHPVEWFPGRRLLQEMPGNRELKLFEGYVRVVESGQPWECKLEYKRDGLKLHILLSACKLGDGFAVSFMDLSGRLAAEELARKEAERLQIALDAGAIIGTWNWDIATNVVQSDERFAWAFGAHPESCRIGMPIEEMVESVHPDDRPQLMQSIDEAIRSGKRFRQQYRVRRSDGQYYWVEAHGRVDNAEDGSPLRFPGILIDVDERRKMEDERDRALALLESFVESVPGLVYANDREGKLLIGNSGLGNIYGTPREDYLGRTAVDLFMDRRQAEIIMSNDRRIMESGVPEQIEEEVNLNDGTPTVWLSTKSPLRDKSGEIIGIIGTSIEITARHRMEEALRESEAKFHAIANSVDQLIWSTDAEGYNDYHNARWYEYTGLEPGTTDGDGWLKVFHPDDRERTWQHWRECVATGSPYEVEYRLRHRSGEYRWVIGRAHPMKSPDGKVLRWYGTCTDIHDLRLAREALVASEQFSRSVIESSADCIAVLEPDGKLEFVNKKGCGLFRTEEGVPVDDAWLDHWPEEGRLAVKDAIAQALSSGRGHCEARCATECGTDKWWDIVATAVRDCSGEPLHVVLTCRDVTEHRKMEEARQLLLRELNHRVKNLFAIASGMVTMTARSADSVADMANKLKGRLLALARAHELIRSAITNDTDRHEQASLRELIAQILKPHLGERTLAISISGPEVGLGVSAATSFALIFHELATNAAKYGALKSTDCHLEISWSLVEGDLELKWAEVVAFPVSEPQHQGFGSRLAITSVTGQLGGSLAYDWRSDGVRIRLTAPLDRIVH